MAVKTGTSLLHGTSLIAAITSVCSAGFLLFGYDQGVMSGVVISKYWLTVMGNPSSLIIGTITALYDVGAVFGAIGAGFMGEWLGRKRTFLLGTVALIIGTVLMGSAYERIQFMVARVFTGIGIGYITSVTPVYQSEITLAKQRGWQYAFYFHNSSVQWRFPLLFQLIFTVYICIVTPFLPDTPRWLMRYAGVEKGLAVLSRLRGKPKDDITVQTEKDEIMEAIRIESKEEGTWGDLFRSNGISAHKRFYLALGIQFMQQMSGINIVTYYAPTLFKSSLGMSEEMALLMGCFLQLWYILASFVTWFTIDRVGRRLLLISMAMGMCAVLVAEAICVAIDNSHASIAAVFFVFAFEACFTWGWMGCVWVYPPEILPLKIRAKGAALAAGADFLGNFLVVEITPVGLENIGWRLYVVFAVLNSVNAMIVWCFYPETSGIKLESVDRLFIEDEVRPAIDKTGRHFFRKLQWDVVPRAAEYRGLDGKEDEESSKTSDEQIERARV